jgi:putative acyl-CoA dehydrogenase
MRQAVAQAIHHASYRVAFQKKLIDQSLMTNVLADLALESEAATVLTMRLARAYDEDDEAALIWRRVMTPAAKFWICKRAPPLIAEAMEVLGGSGYVEECVMPRLYREAPVNSIWEGAGNIMCLDVLRALARMPGAAELLLREILDAAHADKYVQAVANRLQRLFSARDWKDESQARAIVRDLVLSMQAALLLAHAPPAVADAFCGSRLSAESDGAFGLLSAAVQCRAIVERAAPVPQ